jgi:hypothetical protein
MEDRLHLIEELREKILVRIGGHEGERKEIISQLFEEIDRDGSGKLSSSELRDLLRALRLHYSDDKFRRLYKGLDFNKDGSISLDELERALFPEETKQHDMEMRQEAVNEYNSQSASRRDLLSKEQSEKKHSFIAKLSRGFSKTSFIGESHQDDVEMGAAIDGPNEASVNSGLHSKVRNFTSFFSGKSLSTEETSSVLPFDGNDTLPRPHHTSSHSNTPNNKSISGNIVTSDDDYIPPPPSRLRAMSDVSEENSSDYGDNRVRGMSNVSSEFSESEVNDKDNPLGKTFPMSPLNSYGSMTTKQEDNEDDEDSDD